MCMLDMKNVLRHNKKMFVREINRLVSEVMCVSMSRVCKYSIILYLDKGGHGVFVKKLKNQK